MMKNNGTGETGVKGRIVYFCSFVSFLVVFAFSSAAFFDIIKLNT